MEHWNVYHEILAAQWLSVFQVAGAHIIDKRGLHRAEGSFYAIPAVSHA